MRSSSRFAIAVLLGLTPLGLAGSVQAQEPIQLPGIYVQGATLEAPSVLPGTDVADQIKGSEETAGGVPAYGVGNAVSVITREDLQRQQVRQVGDALRSLPGVSVGRSGGFGNLTQVRIRGAEGNHTLVLIDGVEANNTTDGEFDFSNLSVEEIERIEVIRGPMSALYGSSAVGGVVNIITRRGQGPAALTLRTEAGSLGTADLAARLSGGGQWGHFSLGAHWRDTQGFNISPFGGEADGMHLRSLTFRGGLRLTENIGLEMHLRQVDKSADRDGFGGVGGTLATAVDDPSTLRDKVLVGGVVLQWDTLDKQLTHQIHLNHNSTTISDNDLGPFGPFFSANIGERTTYGYLGTYRFDTPVLWAAKHTVSGLVEKESEVFIPEGDLGDGLRRERERLAFAGEWRGTFADQVFITAGVRHDDNSVFNDFTTWRLAGAWAIKSLGLRPHASVGTAVKFPAMFEQFGQFPSFFVPNPNLQPEESLGWDAGIEFTLNSATSLDVTYFRANLENKIASSGLFFPDPTLINLPGTSTREGIEVALRARLAANLTSTVAYTYLDTQESTGAREIRRPRHAGRFDLGYAFADGKGAANLGVMYNGSQTDNVFLNDAKLGFPVPAGRLLLDDYWVVNAAASYKLQPGVEVFGRIENLLDARYQEVFGFQAPPIAAFAGIKLTFGGPEGYGGSWAK